MALNLVRNSRVFFTTSLSTDGSGTIDKAGIDTTNTFEIQVLDGFTFSQNTTQETVTLNEAGATPSRGQRSFATSLDPVDFSFSTYIRPKLNDNATAGNLSDEFVTCEEEVLWNAFAGVAAIGQPNAAWVRTSGLAANAVSTLSFTNSNAHQLQKFAMMMMVDTALFTIENCALDQATIDFGLDGIATIAWTGKGTKLTVFEQTTMNGSQFVNIGTPGTPDGFAGRSAKAKVTDAKYLANKLSTLTMVKGVDGSGTTSHTIPITGGSITFANNHTYLTPANLGIVNQPCTYFTGVRAISGNVTAYLRTNDTNSSSDILTDILAGSTTSQAQAYELTLNIGGSNSATHRVEINVPAAVLSVPTVNAEQVVSTSIDFVAHGYNGTAYDITATNEATIKYYATS
jgi:hypothetical protein